MVDFLEQTGTDSKGFLILKVKVSGYGLFVEVKKETLMLNGVADIRLNKRDALKLKKAVNEYLKNCKEANRDQIRF